MNLLKTSFLTLISTVIKLLSALVINKVVAIFVGPSGLALIGQFQNATQILMTLAQGGISKGVTKYTAEYGKDNELIPTLWSTAAKIVLFCSLSIGVLLTLLSSVLAEKILHNAEYTYIFIVFGFTLVFFALNQFLLSIINGLKEIKLFIAINITQSLYSLIFTSVLIAIFGLDGALLALVTNQSVIFSIVVWRLRKHKVILIEHFKKRFDHKQAKKLSGYSLMALVSVCTVPVSHLIIRNYIGENISWEAAGYWQAIWYISTMYLMIVTTALSTYYLPRLSEIKSKGELRAELKQGYAVIVPVVLLLSSCIYISKELIVYVLFSDEFKPMLELFKWQLIGDMVRMLSFLFAYLLLAKAKVKLVVLGEISFSVLFVVLSYAFITRYGLIGVTYAYSLNYLLYFIFTFFATIKMRGSNEDVDF
ncbi:O-antigen flippase [Colwellia sp. 75C3]|uniref:O-antigen translocase n=1 Tax=Colwellia sp. 75C3 TaxID=888425 RepID=UPI000C32B812|nr:O-antigen translocase [Colwellia sp. 75C3]PKG82230.1 O-antigen flippase [Colwellia sp. 75C3]